MGTRLGLISFQAGCYAARSANVQTPGSTCTGMGEVCTTPTTAALETTPAPAVEELGYILLTMRSTPITTCVSNCTSTRARHQVFREIR